MEVHTTRRTLVKPSVPTQPHLQRFILSQIDQIQPASYVEVLFHYRASGDGAVLEKIRRLEETLSETLSVFYHLAGRYGESGDAINCTDQGVEFVEAKVTGKLDQHLLDSGAKYSEMLLTLPSSSALSPGSSLPLVAIKVNAFECGGLVIGVQVTHLICDMFSICTFMNAWATASRQGMMQVVPPEFELARLAPPEDQKHSVQSQFIVEDQLMPMSSKSFTLKRFFFSNEGLSRLRDEVTTIAKGVDGCKRHPSKVELLTALVCMVVASIDRAKHGRSRPMAVIHAINLRGRTGLPVKENVFGNFYVEVGSAPLVTDNVSDSELFHKLVQCVGDTLRNAIAEFGKFDDGKELARKAETSIKELIEILMKGETNLVWFGSWLRFPLYGVDYGWGRPTLVSTAKGTLGNGFYLMDAENGDGINAWAILEDDDVNDFEHHPDILKYASQQP